MNAGFWVVNYWPTDYWVEDYWADYGTTVITSAKKNYTTLMNIFYRRKKWQ